MAFKLHEYDGDLEQLILHQGQKSFLAVDISWVVIVGVLVEHPDATFECLLRLRDDE
jgi:hypothetical protein